MTRYNGQQKKRNLVRENLQHKTVEHYIECKRHRAIVRKMTRRQRRDDWDKFVKTLERDITETQRDITGTQRDITGTQRDITGTQRQGFKIFKQLQLHERGKLKIDPIPKRNGKNTMKNFGMSKVAKVKKEQKRRGEVKEQTTTET
jgi:hypothetical protein